MPGREILRDNYDYLFGNYPKLVMFGEDAGKLGGVNQTLEGIQEKYGDLRLRDTGIRETTILGKGIGLALRGLRPIAEIQYFDYLLYALQTISDDLATTRYRTKWRTKSASYHKYTWPPIGRHLAFGLTVKHGNKLYTRCLCVRTKRHDPCSRFL